MMDRLFAHLDRKLLTLISIIALFGLYNLISAGAPQGTGLHYKHAAHLLVGFSVMVLLSWIDYRNLRSFAMPLVVASVVLLLATRVFGVMVNGSRRWLNLGVAVFQTSDFAKIAIVVGVARILQLAHDDTRGLSLRAIFRPMNVSRPVVLVGTCLALMVAGDSLRPAKFLQQQGKRQRNMARFFPAEEPMLLGADTSSTAAIRVGGSGVDAEHAWMTWKAEHTLWIQPRNERTLVFVNEQPIQGETLLQDGDFLVLGTRQKRPFQFRQPMQKLRPFLPWTLAIGVLWLLFAAFRLSIKKKKGILDLLAPIDVVALPAGVILVQPDLGTSLVCALVAFSMFAFVGFQRKSFLILCVSGVLVSGFAWNAVLKPYQRERVLSFLNPTSDLAGAGYHQHQSLIAIGSGGLLGKGHRQGTQTHLSFLPEQQTDFIFSVWAEEHGFLGCMLLVFLYVALIVSALRIASSAKDPFGALIAAGVAAMIFWHTLVNMLMVLRFAPVVGVPLPLFSAGGSFVLVTMAGLGLLHSVSSRRNLF